MNIKILLRIEVVFKEMPKNYYYRSLCPRLNEEVESIIYDREKKSIFWIILKEAELFIIHFWTFRYYLFDWDPILL